MVCSEPGTRRPLQVSGLPQGRGFGARTGRLPDPHAGVVGGSAPGYRQLIEGLVGSPDWALAAQSTKCNADRRTGGPRARRTPWVLSFIGLLLVAAGLYVGFNMAFDVVKDLVCNITGRVTTAEMR